MRVSLAYNRVLQNDVKALIKEKTRLERENSALRKAKDMVELERCEMMRSMSLAQNYCEQLRADKERLDWLGSQKGQPWLCWDIPLRLTREVIDAERKEAQP